MKFPFYMLVDFAGGIRTDFTGWLYELYTKMLWVSEDLDEILTVACVSGLLKGRNTESIIVRIDGQSQFKTYAYRSWCYLEGRLDEGCVPCYVKVPEPGEKFKVLMVGNDKSFEAFYHVHPIPTVENYRQCA